MREMLSPTGAIIGPWQIDARRCISYLTIEHKGSIPEDLRPLLGNRIFGCDDCQIVCPWNRTARASREPAFTPRPHWQSAPLTHLFAWSEAEWERNTAGSPLRRTGYVRWLRNLAVALGNAPADAETLQALHTRREHPEPLVREHVQWAITRQEKKRAGQDARRSDL